MYAGIVWVAPYFDQPVSPPTYSHTLQFKIGSQDGFNETFIASNLNYKSGQLILYDSAWNLKETIAVSGGLFTSAFYYPSGTILRYRFSATGFQTISGLFTMPYYESTTPPSYHILSNLVIHANPTSKCTYSLQGAYNTTALTKYLTTSGTTITVSLEFYNTGDESALRNWADQSYSYVPLVIVENVYLNATSKPLDIKVQGLETVRVETATQTGIYIARPVETGLDRNKNQATGNLITNNRITITFTIDASQIGAGELGLLRFTLMDNVDVNYYRTYCAANSAGETLQGCPIYWTPYVAGYKTFNVAISSAVCTLA